MPNYIAYNSRFKRHFTFIFAVLLFLTVRNLGANPQLLTVYGHKPKVACV